MVGGEQPAQDELYGDISTIMNTILLFLVGTAEVTASIALVVIDDVARGNQSCILSAKSSAARTLVGHCSHWLCS